MLRTHRYPQPGRRRPLFFYLIVVILCISFYLIWQLFSNITQENGDGLGNYARAKNLSFAEEYPSGALPPNLKFDKIVVEKSKRLMYAYSQGKIVRVYKIALGGNPVGHKEYEGDMKTPEGTYIIDDKNPKSAYYKNVNISYPNEADKEHAKKLNKPAGGDIKIHGLAPHFAYVGAAHRVSDWTHGCIAVTNPEMEEIYTRIILGAPIEIKP